MFKVMVIDASQDELPTLNFKIESGTSMPYAHKIERDKEKAIIEPEVLMTGNRMIKALYVKNIHENVTTYQLKDLFQRHGEVKKVVMPPGKAGGKHDFGFIYYAERSSALKFVKEIEKYEIYGVGYGVAGGYQQVFRNSQKIFTIVVFVLGLFFVIIYLYLMGSHVRSNNQ
ncbi:hypothetical protein RYX36_000565 [Vicia faba]